MVYQPPYPIIRQEGGRRRLNFVTKNGQPISFASRMGRKSRKGPIVGQRRVNFRTKSGREVSFSANTRKKAPKQRRRRRGKKNKRIIRGRGFADEQLKSLAGEVGRTAISEAASLGIRGISSLRNKFKRRRERKAKVPPINVPSEIPWHV